MDLINELENDVAMAVFLRRQHSKNTPKHEVRDLIRRLQSALRPLADRSPRYFQHEKVFNKPEPSE